MIRKLLGWLDDRTGARALVNAVLFENIPGGARWRYIWGSTLVFTQAHYIKTRRWESIRHPCLEILFTFQTVQIRTALPDLAAYFAGGKGIGMHVHMGVAAFDIVDSD